MVLEIWDSQNSHKRFVWSTLKVNIWTTKNAETFKHGNNVNLELINPQAKNQPFISSCSDLKQKKQKINFFKKTRKYYAKRCAFVAVLFRAVWAFCPENLSTVTSRVLETINLEDFQKVETFMEQKIDTWLLITKPKPKFLKNGYASPKIGSTSPKKKHFQIVKNLSRFRKK